MNAAAAAMPLNHQARLRARPTGIPDASNWSFTEEPVPRPPKGGLVVKVLTRSLDPAMRGWMHEGRSYLPPVAIGEVMRCGGIGRVLASDHPDFAAGDYVIGLLGVQEYSASAPNRWRLPIWPRSIPCWARSRIGWCCAAPGWRPTSGCSRSASPSRVRRWSSRARPSPWDSSQASSRRSRAAA